MNPHAIDKVLALAARMGRILVATADAGGLPHVAAAGHLALDPSGRLAVEAWFCPGTVQNLRANRRVALVVWEPVSDEGYQVLGTVEAVEESAMLDGFAPAAEAGRPIPQVERRLLVRIERVLDFTHAPHTDVAE